jgi:hypothetical protein
VLAAANLRHPHVHAHGQARQQRQPHPPGPAARGSAAQPGGPAPPARLATSSTTRQSTAQLQPRTQLQSTSRVPDSAAAAAAVRHAAPPARFSLQSGLKNLGGRAGGTGWAGGVAEQQDGGCGPAKAPCAHLQPGRRDQQSRAQCQGCGGSCCCDLQARTAAGSRTAASGTQHPCTCGSKPCCRRHFLAGRRQLPTAAAAHLQAQPQPRAQHGRPAPSASQP